MEYQEKIRIYERAKRIVGSDLEWDQKYDMIFSEEISKKFILDYYGPDTSYEEDVRAFMDALDHHMEKQRIISEQIDY